MKTSFSEYFLKLQKISLDGLQFHVFCDVGYVNKMAAPQQPMIKVHCAVYLEER